MSRQRVFGIDVAKKELEVAIEPGESRLTVANTTTGIQRLIDKVDQYEQPLVVMESTGGYQRRCAEALIAADIEVVVVNPRQARDFAKACGRLEKTDHIDAKGLAKMGATLELNSADEPDETKQRLKELSRFRQRLVEQRTQLKNRRDQQRYPDLKEMLDEQIETLDERIEEVEQKIDELVSCSAQLSEQIERLQTVPGIGEQTAQSLMANLPELGDLNRKEVAKLAGVAPLNHDSGTHRGARRIRGGRPRVRRALYMAALSAKKWCQPIKHFYNRLLERGKAKKVALVACMRKLVTILNSMMRTETSFEPQKAMPNG